MCFISVLLSDMKLWKMLLYGLGALPWIFTISLWGFYYHVAKLLRYYPTSNHPGFGHFHCSDLYCHFMSYLSITWMLSIPLFALMTLIFFILKNKLLYVHCHYHVRIPNCDCPCRIVDILIEQIEFAHIKILTH